MGFNPPINVTLISAEGIKDLNWFRKMDVYAEAWIKGLEENKKSTSVAKKCGTNPKWDYNRMTFTYAELYPGGLIPDPYLIVQLMAKRTGRRTTDKIIGSITIRINDFFYGMNEERIVQYKINVKSGKTKGLLQFSYNFVSERPETKAQANEPLLEYQTELIANEPYKSKYQKTCEHLMFENSDSSNEELQTKLTVYEPETKAHANEQLPEYQTKLPFYEPYESKYRKMCNRHIFEDSDSDNDLDRHIFEDSDSDNDLNCSTFVSAMVG